MWVPALAPQVQACGATTTRRIAAFVGQWVPEVGEDYSELNECTAYRAARLVEIFPSRFPSLDVARRYEGRPDAIADRAYSFKLGNGDEASGDGHKFKGAGLPQLTGRDEHSGFAKWCGKPVDEASAWARTPPGAAAAAAYYWQSRNLNRFADAWDIRGLRRAVNGAACLGLDVAQAASDRALRALGG